ncbi:MAG: hypothetical protein ACK5PW_19655 [Burkholderiales bacterium]|jgi:hypothetical protein
MNADALSYALAKQLQTAHSLETAYGTVELDEELSAAVAAALRPILTARLAAVRDAPQLVSRVLGDIR